MSDLTGVKWKAVIVGRRTLSGERHSVIVVGDISHGEGTVFDALREIADRAEDECDMEYPDSAQITIYAPGTTHT